VFPRNRKTRHIYIAPRWFIFRSCFIAAALPLSPLVTSHGTVPQHKVTSSDGGAAGGKPFAAVGDVAATGCCLSSSSEGIRLLSLFNDTYSAAPLSPGVKGGRGVMLTTHPLLVSRLRKSRSYTSCHPDAPLWSVTGPQHITKFCIFLNFKL
jgi:hypothetical protein